MTISLEDVRRVLDSHNLPYQVPEAAEWDMIILRGTADIIEPFGDAWSYYVRATHGRKTENHMFWTTDELHKLLELYSVPQPYDEYSAAPLPPL